MMKAELQFLSLVLVSVFLTSCASVNETRLQNGYFLRKTNIGRNVCRLSLWREIEAEKRLVCETISENGQIQSLLPTPYSFGCVARFKSDFFQVVRCGDDPLHTVWVASLAQNGDPVIAGSDFGAATNWSVDQTAKISKSFQSILATKYPNYNNSNDGLNHILLVIQLPLSQDVFVNGISQLSSVADHALAILPDSGPLGSTHIYPFLHISPLGCELHDWIITEYTMSNDSKSKKALYENLTEIIERYRKEYEDANKSSEATPLPGAPQ